MDIGSAFTYMFDDEEWIKKLAIGGGIALLGFILLPVLLVGLVLFLPLSGYMLEVLKNVRDGQPKPLPEWTDFGALFSKGLMVFVIGFIYNLPAMIFSCAAAAINISSPQLDPDMVETLAMVAVCLNCVQFILSLVGNALVPAALIRYAEHDTFGSAFQFGEIFSFIGSNIGDYIIAILLSWVASFVAVFGVILCVVGLFFTGFWSILVAGNLYGQLARKTQATV